MSFNGSGTFQINSAGQPVVSGTVISSTAFNALTADLATGLSTCITKDGQTTPTANIPMGNNKITNLAVGTAASDAATLSQAQSTAAKLINTVAGTDTITGTLAPVLGAYAAGQMFYWVAAGDNTGPVTLNIDGLGAKAVTRDGSVALAAGDIKSGEVVVVVYDGTRFQVVSQINSGGDARFANVSITSALNVGGVATFTGGTANGVTYLNGSKVLTSGTALVFDGTNLGIGVTPSAWSSTLIKAIQIGDNNGSISSYTTGNTSSDWLFLNNNAYYDAGGWKYIASSTAAQYAITANEHRWYNAGSGTAGNTISFTQAMTLDASGRLQIGTITQDGMLTVVAPASTAYGTFDAASSSFANLTFKTGGTAYAYIGSANAFVTSGTANDFAIRSQNALTFATGGATERMRLDSSGNLSVGAVLAENSVGAYLLPSGEMRVKDSTEDGTSQISIYNTNTSADAEQFFAAMNSSDVDMGNRRSGALKLFTNNIERARITSGGNFQLTSGGQIELNVSTLSSKGAIAAFNSDSANGGLVFKTEASSTLTERARITSGGDLLVGTTSNGSSSRMIVNGTATGANQRILQILSTTAGDVSNAALLVSKRDNNTTTSQVFVQFSVNNDSTASGQINANGASQAAFGSWSDRRLKENIVELPSQWSNIKALRPVEFDYVAKEGGGHQLGFIAQEVQEIYPDLVGERQDGMLTLSGMGKGEARLIKVLQEAMARIEQLEAKVAALETK